MSVRTTRSREVDLCRRGRGRTGVQQLSAGQRGPVRRGQHAGEAALLVALGLVGPARLAAQRAARRQGRRGVDTLHHVDHQRRGGHAAEADRGALTVVERVERPDRAVATGRGDHDTQCGTGPEGVDDRIDRDLHQRVRGPATGFGSRSTQVGRGR